MAIRGQVPFLKVALPQAVAWLAAIAACGAEPAAMPPQPDRIALLPPVEFNLEEGFFASEPIADADPEPVPALR